MLIKWVSVYYSTIIREFASFSRLYLRQRLTTGQYEESERLWGIYLWWFYQNPPLLAQGLIGKRRQKEWRQKELSTKGIRWLWETISFRHSIINTNMNSRWLWHYAQDMFKSKPGNIPAQRIRSRHKFLSAAMNIGNW